MKNIAILLAVALALALPLAAYAAGANKVVFVPGENPDGSSGFVIINDTPGGAVEQVVQIQIRGGQPQTEYEVKSGGVSLGMFTTNKNGSGGIHLNLAPGEELAGGYVNIWCGGHRGPKGTDSLVAFSRMGRVQIAA